VGCWCVQAAAQRIMFSAGLPVLLPTGRQYAMSTAATGGMPRKPPALVARCARLYAVASYAWGQEPLSFVQ